MTLGAITSGLSDRVSAQDSAASSAQADDSARAIPITVSLSGPAEVDEGAAATYTVSLSPAGVTPTADLTVSYATADGTATAGEDYTATSSTLTFTQDSHGDRTVDVQTTDEILSEGSETFTSAISNPQGGGGVVRLATSSATTTIIDDDFSDDPEDLNPETVTPRDIWLTVFPDSVNENAGATNFTVTATYDAGKTRTDDVTIRLFLMGTADSSDYTAPAQASVTITAGQPSGTSTLTLTMKDDNISEGDETIIVAGRFAGLAIGSDVITINDDDSPYLSISGPSADVAEGSNATFAVTLSKTVTADVTVAWEVVAGTAEASDYNATTGSVTFPANSAAGATQSMTVPITDDRLSEGEETFSVELGADTGDQAGSVWVKTTAASASATISESDPITVNIAGPSSVIEGAATTDYTVSLSPAGVTPTQDLTVNYATADGTATAVDDYTSATGTLTFTQAAAGPQTLTVQTTEDTLDESDETFTVSVSSLSGGGGPAPIMGTDSVTTTIADDDGTPTAITLSVSPDSIAENASTTDITLTAALAGSSTLSTDTTVTITLGGMASSTDYSATPPANVTIPAGRLSGTSTMTFAPADDEVVEGDETVTVSGAATDFTVVGDTLTLTDDDRAELSINGPTSEVPEGSDAIFTVSISGEVVSGVTVAWSVTPNTASATDLGTATGTTTFTAGSNANATRTITIAVTADELSETAETFSVVLGAVSGDLASRVSLKPDSSSATATIAESDPITVHVSGPETVAEGATTADYTVSLSPAGVTPSQNLTVDYATADGTAIAGEDYMTANRHAYLHAGRQSRQDLCCAADKR